MTGLFTRRACLITMSVFILSARIKAQERQPEWEANWYPINWEAEKIEKGITTDTIFIHHTAWEPDATWQRMSDEQKKRLYDARYGIANKDPFVQGQPSHSGHYRYVDG